MNGASSPGSFGARIDVNLRKNAMRQSGILMMDAVIWFVEQRVSEKTTEPAFRHDAARRAVHCVSGQPECSTYLRQLWRLAAIIAGTRYSQRKYFQPPQKARAA